MSNNEQIDIGSFEISYYAGGPPSGWLWSTEEGGIPSFYWVLHKPATPCPVTDPTCYRPPSGGNSPQNLVFTHTAVHADWAAFCTWVCQRVADLGYSPANLVYEKTVWASFNLTHCDCH